VNTSNDRSKRPDGDDTVRHPQSRFDTTTEHLLDTADRLVIDNGLRELSLESVSSTGYASTGSVYERWRSKWQLIDELTDQRFERHWTRLVDGSEHLSLSDRLRRFEESTEGRLAGTWFVETLHLARVRPDFLPRTHSLTDRVTQWLSVDDESTDSPTSIGCSQWLVATMIGVHQLRIGGAQMPPMSSDMATLVAPPPADRRPTVADTSIDRIPGTEPLPTSEIDRRDIDDVSRHIVGVTRTLLASAAGELSVRSILGHSNVSSTTLYRRFESKRQLLLQVLNGELSSASYEWVIELVDSLGTDDPIGGMARVFRRRFDTLTAYPDTRNVILELTAQARNDADLRRTLIGQVERMAGVRAELFDRLQAARVLRGSISPTVAGWLVQAPASGYRLLVGAGIPVDPDHVEAAISRIFWNALSD
jgi:AcrR family transcriptional regulator